MKQAFTLIEILVVATIISLLASIAIVSYSQFVKQSRDAKRKADLEQIRAAVEQWRSNNGTYPTGVNAIEFNTGSCTANPSGGLVDSSSITYLSKIPNDPQCSSGKPTYYYSSSDGSSYTVGAFLETSSVSGCGGSGSCGTGYNCNYCVGPYGQTN